MSEPRPISADATLTGGNTCGDCGRDLRPDEPWWRDEARDVDLCPDCGLADRRGATRATANAIVPNARLVAWLRDFCQCSNTALPCCWEKAASLIQAQEREIACLTREATHIEVSEAAIAGKPSSEPGFFTITMSGAARVVKLRLSDKAKVAMHMATGPAAQEQIHDTDLSPKAERCPECKGSGGDCIGACTKAQCGLCRGARVVTREQAEAYQATASNLRAANG